MGGLIYLIQRRWVCVSVPILLTKCTYIHTGTVQVVSADVQSAPPWSGTSVYRRSLPTSHIRWQQTETAICHLRRPRGQLLRHALRRPCIRCGGPKGMKPAAGTFTGTRGSWPLRDGMKDVFTPPSDCRKLFGHIMTFTLRRVRNCWRYYYYCLLYTSPSPRD